MSKKYFIYNVSEFRKRFSHTNTTETTIRPWGYGFEGEDNGLGGDLVLTTDDNLTPDFHDKFLVTIEPIPNAPSNDGNVWREHFTKILADRRAKDQGAVDVPKGRKFR